MQAIAQNLPAAFDGVDFTRLTDALGDVGTELNNLFDVDLTTTEGLQSAIQQIVDAIAALTEFV